MSGSPRRNGNTDRLAASFARGAGEHNRVEIVSVADLAVHPCIGCDSCFMREGNACFRHDDMDLLYGKLRQTDVLIIASPVYFYGISAQLKAVIDRMHTPLRNSFPIRKLGLILVGAAELPDLFDSIITQYRLILRFFGLDDAGMVLARGARGKGDVMQEDLDEAYRLGRTVT